MSVAYGLALLPAQLPTGVVAQLLSQGDNELALVSQAAELRSLDQVDDALTVTVKDNSLQPLRGGTAESQLQPVCLGLDVRRRFDDLCG